MKIVEALKRVKANKDKIVDLQGMISKNSARLSHETPAYARDGHDNTPAKITEWAQACDDLTQENIRLLVAISRTNLATNVAIQVADKTVHKSIAEWIWRRREYAAVDLKTWQGMTDRNLKEGVMVASTGVNMEVKLVRAYDPERRDKKVAEYKGEAAEIDATLEVINAVTDLIEA